MYREDILDKIHELQRQVDASNDYEYRGVLIRRIKAYKAQLPEAKRREEQPDKSAGIHTRELDSWEEMFAKAFEEVTGIPYEDAQVWKPEG